MGGAFSNLPPQAVPPLYQEGKEIKQKVPPWKDWKSYKSPLIKGDLEGFGDAEGRGIC